MTKERICFLSNSDLKRLYVVMDALSLNDVDVAFFFDVSRQYINVIFSRGAMSPRVCKLYISLIGFLEKVIIKKPELSLRKSARDCIDSHHLQKNEQLDVLKAAFIKYNNRR